MTNANTSTDYLSRRQYDYLVRNCPSWMALRWAEFTKRWSLGWVYVTGTPAALENLRCQLPVPEGC